MNEIVNFLQQIAIAKHGSLQEAKWGENQTQWIFRCPICGDSKRNKSKRRFYVSKSTNEFFCFNCIQKGPWEKLISLFPDAKDVDYKALNEYTSNKIVKEFLGENKEQIVHQIEENINIVFPEGSRLDYLVDTKLWKELPNDDKRLFHEVIKMLTRRKVKKEMFRFFYFVFAGQEDSNYLLTLFDFKGDVAWSGRKIDDAKYGPKYKHIPNLPFHSILGFEEYIHPNNGKELYVVESWFSALSLVQNHKNAVCVFGIQNMKYKHEALRQYYKDYDVIFVPDNDPSVQIFYDLNRGYENSIKMLQLPSKDVNDMEQEFGDKFIDEFNKLKPVSIADAKLLHTLERIF